jgi:hypothetical protein
MHLRDTSCLTGRPPDVMAAVPSRATEARPGTSS